MAKVNELLAIKGDVIHTVDKNVTVLAATQCMNEHQVGAVIVTQDGQVIGMFTERDVLRRIVGEQRDPVTTSVGTVMTRKVVSCQLDHDLQEVRATMMKRKIRHLPVTDLNNNLLGLISIGDLNAWSIHNGQTEIEFMKDFVYGRS